VTKVTNVSARPLGVINIAPPERGKFVTTVAVSSKRRSLMIAGDADDEVFIIRSINVTRQNSI